MIEANLKHKEDYRALAQVFAIRQGFSPIDIRRRFPDLPPDTSPGGLRIVDCELHQRCIRLIAAYSEVEGHLAYHIRFHILIVVAVHSITKGHFVLIVMKNDSIFDTKHVHANPKRLRLCDSVSPFSQNITNRRWL